MHPAPRPRVPRVVLTERLYHEHPVLMLPRIASRSLWCAVLLALGALQPAARGQVFGNQAKGSIARVTNGLAFSYPGYNEMLTGHPDPRIDSNRFGPNPNPTVFEWLNGLAELHGRVSVYATWETFKDIFNVRRSGLPLQVGWDLPY